MKKDYDYIIVGGGTSGCVLANRLSEDPDVLVLLIEAGRDDSRVKQQLPLEQPHPFPNPRTNSDWGSLIRGGPFTYSHLTRVGFVSWEHTPCLRDGQCEVDGANGERSVFYPRGSTWGGSSAQNFGVALRGSPRMWDEWAQLGNTEWSYEKVLPYFKKYENRSQRTSNIPNETKRYWDPFGKPKAFGTFDPNVHGDSGPVALLRPFHEDPLSKAVKRSAELLDRGIVPDADFDQETTEGVIASCPISALDQAGPDFARLNTYDGPFQFPQSYAGIGFAGAPCPIQRVHAAAAYIYPIQNRKNLTVVSETFVTKVLCDDHKRCIGVECLEGWNIYKAGRKRNTSEAGLGGTPLDAAYNAEKAKTKGKIVFKATREVILCGGAYNSPQLLMLSGIGPKEHLKDVGIPVLKDLPGVGSHLVDHAEVDICFRMREKLNPFKYVLSGHLHESVIITMKFKSSPEEDYTDFHVHLINGGLTTGGGGGLTDLPFRAYKSDNGKVVNLGAAAYFGPPQYVFPPDQVVGSPEVTLKKGASSTLITLDDHCSLLLEQIGDIKSEGTVRLHSSDPTDACRITGNYLANPADLEKHVRMFRDVIVPWIENLAKDSSTYFTEKSKDGNPPFESIPGGEGFFEAWVHPTREEFSTDGRFDEEKYRKFLLNHVWAHHASGTCKMGPDSDPMAVVDQRGQVYGVKGLRVCDASIAPVIPNANTQTPCYMYGEKMADLIKEDHK